MLHIKNVLRDLREKDKRTQEYMGRRLGISQSQYNKIEKGEKPLDVEMLINMAGVFRIEPKQLFHAICVQENIAAPQYVISTADREADEQEHSYKGMAAYFEKKFMEVYRLYIELLNKVKSDPTELYTGEPLTLAERA